MMEQALKQRIDDAISSLMSGEGCNVQMTEAEAEEAVQYVMKLVNTEISCEHCPYK